MSRIFILFSLLFSYQVLIAQKNFSEFEILNKIHSISAIAFEEKYKFSIYEGEYDSEIIDYLRRTSKKLDSVKTVLLIDKVRETISKKSLRNSELAVVCLAMYHLAFPELEILSDKSFYLAIEEKELLSSLEIDCFKAAVKNFDIENQQFSSLRAKENLSGLDVFLAQLLGYFEGCQNSLKK